MSAVKTLSAVMWVTGTLFVQGSVWGGDAPEKPDASEKNRGLILCLKLDEGKGAVAHDSSGLNHHARINGAKWVDGKPALEFNGDESHMVITNFAGLPTEAITISVWQKVREARAQHLFNLSPDDSGDRISAHTPWEDNQVYFDFGIADYDGDGRVNYTPPKPIAGTWQHFVFVASTAGKCSRIYRNGVMEVSAPNAPEYSGATKDLYIGAGSDALNAYAGLIGEFRMYNRVLTDEEIKALYQDKAGYYKE